MKKVNFVPKDVQRILLSHKILEKYNEQKVFHKKAVHKTIAKIPTVPNFLRLSRNQAPCPKVLKYNKPVTN